MRHTELELDPFSGGSANGYNGKFTLQLPPGVTYKQITLFGEGLKNDQIERVEITLNGDKIYDVSGDVLRMIQAYKGKYQEEGTWVIPFCDFSMETQDGQNITNLVTLPNENVILQVTTGQRENGNPDVASLTATAILGVTRQVREFVPRMYSDVMNGGVAGENKYRNFVNQNKSANPVRIRRMHLHDTNITNLEIKRNNITLFDLKKRQNDFSLKEFNRNPQDGWFTFDAVKTGFGLADPLDTQAGSFEIITTKSQVGDFVAVFETIEMIPVRNARVA